jgi:exodeoxyribonuclease VII large subunit
VELQQRLKQLELSVRRLTSDRLHNARQTLAALQARLERLHPQQRLNQQHQRLDELEARMRRAVNTRLQQAGTRVEHARSTLLGQGPHTRLQQRRLSVQHLNGRLQRAMQYALDRRRQTLTALSRNLDAVSPLATLRRGYAIVTRPVSGRPVVDASEVDRGEALNVRLARGELGIEVKHIESRPEGGEKTD